MRPLLGSLIVLVLTAGACVAQPPEGPTSAPDLTKVYAAGLRGFNKKLTSAVSEQLAVIIISSARKHKIDARLLVAVLVEDGLIARARGTGDQLKLGTKLAADLVDALAEELQERLTRLSAGEKIEPETLRKALAEHAPREKGYSDRVLRLYSNLVGRPKTPPPPPPPG